MREDVEQAAKVVSRRVFIDRYELMGRVGVYERERRYEQRLVVSLELDVIDRYDGSTDKLASVYNYEHAINLVTAVVDSGHFNLLETLAERIAEACLEDADVVFARVRIAKPDVLIACRSVGIEIERDRRR